MSRPSVVLAITVLLTLAVGCSSGGPPTAAGTTIPAREGSLLQPLAEATDDGAYALYWMRDCAPPEKATDVATCLLVAGERRPTTGPDRADELVRALLAGPDDAEKAVGLSTNIRTITEYQGIAQDGDLVTVRFNRYFETAKTRPQVAQVVYTLTQLPGVERVQILVDGTPNGAVGATPQDRASTNEFLGPLFVDQPAMGQTMSGLFAVRGSMGLPPPGAGPGIGYRFELADGTTSPPTGESPSGAALGDEGGRAPFLIPVTVPTGAPGPATLVVFRPGPDGQPADEQRVPVVLG